ncbi:MAG: 50S ribosomal protein L21 [Candidatus Magasanikbacteria bacterium]|jgi:large subunit ribosomal protein L21|nr:50S ribosomal protein L21 [Candidatus Magasanikbacteria bacterium]MBT4221068.1 50S ribosomal protein L21 [Candidatus Magasanikbacteria bacterium]MBT4350588.1 50S ribosomal protein L21 [Candidatus Magasanikbacteria bacterium]MBT4542113.1 50S ribosomal protein L21 [Candidatus Magasanikbacteria bacterium]MBT6253235.1 50S ribosomal protein L21 [Candidatus Magasanikbacteria bacterium]
MFAVIETGGKQHLIESGQTLQIGKVEGEKDVIFDKVLLLANDDGTDVQIGTPYLDGVTIEAVVQEQGRTKKLRVIKYKPKVRYKKVQGHRQHFTRIKVKDNK